MRALQDLLSSLGGVREVQVNPTTGSLLLSYDPETLDMAELLLAAQNANVKVVVPGLDQQATVEEGVSDVARRLNDRFSQVDRAVSRATGGRLDAKAAAPLALGAVAVRQLLTQGAGLSAIPWYVLLWYSFEIFTKYNVGKRTKPLDTLNVQQDLGPSGI